MFEIVISIIGILLTIFFIVGIHEFGHFIVARWMGIKVLRFSIGFGKKLYSKYDKKGTEYVLAAIPLGGYVKMLDETEGEVSPNEQHLAYNRQPLYKKIAVIIAGPLFNLIFAFLLYWILFVIGFTTIPPLVGKISPNSIASAAGMKPHEEIVKINQQVTSDWTHVLIQLMKYIGSHKQIDIQTQDLDTQLTKNYSLNLSQWEIDPLNPNPLKSLGIAPYEPTIPAIIGKIQPHSPAENAQFKIGDEILSIDKKSISTWIDVVNIISAHPNQILNFTIRRQGQILNFPVKIGYKQNLMQKQGYLGFYADFEWPKELLRQHQYGLIKASAYALQNTYDYIHLNFLMLGKLLTGQISFQSLGGPITIFGSAATSLNSGISSFINFLAFLSIAIGIINVLPIPGLDGGHLLFYGIEWITGRPISQKLQILLYRFGFILLIMILIQALINDIMRI